MTDQNVNYDDVKQYRLDPEREQELVASAGECVFCWANKAGHPIGVITAYVPVKGKIWMTATRERVRVKAIRRDGRSSVVISSKGTPMGGGKTVTYKGHTVIHDDDEDQALDGSTVCWPQGMAGLRRRRQRVHAANLEPGAIFVQISRHAGANSPRVYAGDVDPLRRGQDGEGDGGGLRGIREAGEAGIVCPGRLPRRESIQLRIAKRRRPLSAPRRV